MKERREYIRLSESLKIFYKVLDSQGASRKGSFTEDLSGGGIRFAVNHHLEIGSCIELSLYLLDEKEPVVAQGEVMWLRERDDIKFPYIVGIKFVDIKPFERGKILNYIRQRIVDNKPSEINWLD